MADNAAIPSEHAARHCSQDQIAAALWQFSLAFYPSSQQLLLRLQDAHGSNINVLLCICWLSLQQQQLTAGQLAQLLVAIAPVNQQVTAPLRQIRRNLSPSTEHFKTMLLAAELKAEQQEQQHIAQVLAECWPELLMLEHPIIALQMYLNAGRSDVAAAQSLLVDLDQAIRGYTPNHGETLI
jgi:uncharacterized protein (TIGR02444 family)